jgi:hypothetical protein
VRINGRAEFLEKVEPDYDCNAVAVRFREATIYLDPQEAVNLSIALDAATQDLRMFNEDRGLRNINPEDVTKGADGQYQWNF